MGRNSPDTSQPDFRSEAVALSLAVVARMTSIDIERGDLTQFNTSLCLPAAGNPADFRRQYGRVIKAVAVLGFGGTIGGTILLVFAFFRDAHPPILGAAGIACFAVGNALMIGAIGIRNLIFARYATRVGLPRPETLTGVQQFGVSIEEPSTIRRIKAVTEDIGHLYLDSQRHLATIEGFSHRYVICAADLQRCVFQRSQHVTHLLVKFAIAGTEQTLAISIAYDNALEALRRQIGTQRRPPLAEPWEQAMGVLIEANVEPAPPLPPKR